MEDGFARRLKRRLATTAFILAILYVGAHVLSRTEGIRSLVADKISNGTRLPVTLEKCGMTPLLGLRLEGLVLQGMDLMDVEISFNWLCWLSKEKPFIDRVAIKNAEFDFRRTPAGTWEPLVLNGIGQQLGAVVGTNAERMGQHGELPKFPAFAINAKTRLSLKNTKIVWRDPQGKELATIEKADYHVAVARLKDRKIIRSTVQCDRIRLASGRNLEDFRLETIHVAGTEWVTVLEMSDAGGEYPPFATSTLWQDLGRQLNKLSSVE